MEKLYCSEIVKVILKSDRWNLADQEAASLRWSSFISGSSTTKTTWFAYHEKELTSQPDHCENKNTDRLCRKILILQFWKMVESSLQRVGLASQLWLTPDFLYHPQ